MTYASWEPRHRCTTVAPGKLDLFVVTFIDGKRGIIGPITDYDAALAKAQGFHRDHPCQIKVLPMTGTELFNLFGIVPPKHPEPLDAELRQQLIDTLMGVARESADGDARADAFKLLSKMGVIRP